jgi:membrane associated rhomboid family serine protease
MSSLLRLSRTLRTLRTPKTARTTSSHFFSPSHTPRHLGLPQPRPRLFSSQAFAAYKAQVKSNEYVLYGLMGINITIFGYAYFLREKAKQGFYEPFAKFMNTMTLNLDRFREGNYASLITSVFTHVDPWHLISNMVSVYFLGGFLAASPIITPMRYLTIALGAGIAGGVGTLFNRYFNLKAKGGYTRDHIQNLGFSGAVMGISSVAACLAPHTKVLIYGIIPMPLWALVGFYAVYDGYYLNNPNSNIGHAGHLGGLAFGIAYYFVKLRSLRVW